jgi:putative ATP-binding cassette transporter
MKNISLLLGKPSRLIYYIFLSIISGSLSFAFMAFVNFLVNQLLEGKAKNPNPFYVLLFVLIIFFFVLSRRVFATTLIDFSQRIFWRIRNDIIDLMLQTNYENFIQYQNSLHASLVRDVTILTAASVNVVQFSSSVVIILASFAYMAFLSLPLFACTFVVLSLGVLVYNKNIKRNQDYFTTSRNLEDAFILNFNSLVHGFKEINLAPNKGDDIVNYEMRMVQESAIISNRNAYVGFLNNQIIGQVLFNCLIGLILLVIAYWFALRVSVIVDFMFILLFLLNAAESAMVMLPSLVQAKVSLDRITALREELQGEQVTSKPANLLPPLTDFQEIVLAGITHAYRKEQAEPTFSVGPVDLHIRKGEVIFIYGGNGSGKTTFILSLLGLLKPTQGTISCDGRVIQADAYKAYQSLFGVVFNDFHLFNKLFGIPTVDETLVRYYLELFELSHKVTYSNKAFSTRDLSTGQRKRLALIAVLLEKKPILVLDEWAADQDAYFRKKFYTQIIPLLKDAGFTILAITHDDKYYNCCDRIFEMNHGRLRQALVESIST